MYDPVFDPSTTTLRPIRSYVCKNLIYIKSGFCFTEYKY